MRRFIVAVLATAMLSGCGTASTDSSTAASTSQITVTDAFVKATEAGATAPYMTGAFMTIRNGTAADVTLTGATADFAPKVEVHEVVNGVMRPKQGGLRIAAGSSVTLAMGGNHLMFMGMVQPLVAGDEVRFRLTFSGADPIEVMAPVKASNAGSETYQPTPMPSATGM